MANLVGFGACRGKLPQLTDQRLPRFGGATSKSVRAGHAPQMFMIRLDDRDGGSTSPRTDAHQRRPFDMQVAIEHRLDADREQCAVGRDNAVVLSAAIRLAYSQASPIVFPFRITASTNAARKMSPQPIQAT